MGAAKSMWQDKWEEDLTRHHDYKCDSTCLICEDLRSFEPDYEGVA
jgi:hypothetical protein